VETLRIEKCVKQLEILSNLRNLQSLIIELIPKIMALEYDIKKDLRYIEGREEERRINIEKALRAKLLTTAQIADMFEVPLEDVLAIQKNLNLE
jgi:predicted transposase YdaD